MCPHRHGLALTPQVAILNELIVGQRLPHWRWYWLCYYTQLLLSSSLDTHLTLLSSIRIRSKPLTSLLGQQSLMFFSMSTAITAGTRAVWTTLVMLGCAGWTGFFFI